MNVLSLFDGMSCARIALDRAGIKIDKYYSSEIDKYAIKVSNNNYYDTIYMGDISKWRSWKIDWSSIGLLIGGSPCQGFSLIGKQLSFEDPRSRLFFDYLDILNHIKSVNPSIQFLLENVRMKVEDMDRITGMLNVEPVFIDSKLLSAASRPRWYWSNFIWQDIKYASDMEQCNSCGEAFCDIHKKHYADCECIGPDEEDNIILNKTNDRAFRMPEDAGISYKSVVEDITLKPATVRKGNPRPINFTGEKFLCLTATYYKGIRADGRPALSRAEGDFDVVRDDGDCRMLTPNECELLMTVPKDYTSSVSNTQRYKMLGNGFTVNVIAYIFKNLKQG